MPRKKQRIKTHREKDKWQDEADKEKGGGVEKDLRGGGRESQRENQTASKGSWCHRAVIKNKSGTQKQPSRFSQLMRRRTTPSECACISMRKRDTYGFGKRESQRSLAQKKNFTEPIQLRVDRGQQIEIISIFAQTCKILEQIRIKFTKLHGNQSYYAINNSEVT